MGSVANIASAIAQNSTAANSGNSVPSLASDFNTFLQLLTTQLQNQDPTNPVDSNQFTQQLVEFAGVQQQTQTNSLLQQLLTAVQGNEISGASSYIGTTIQASGSQVGLSGGNSQIGYTLGSGAANATVTITDSSGNTVFTGNAPTAAGNNTVKWNGINSFNGSTEPDGVYNVAVTATDANDNPVMATPFETGTVSSASIQNGQVMLNLGGGLQVPISNVTSISNLNNTSAQTNSLLQQLLSGLSSSSTPSS